MANRRLFSKAIVRSDAFLDMPLTSQCLYFHLGMEADDDGFVSNVRSLMRTIGAKEDDLKILIAKCFIIDFPDGVVLVKHWKINNYIRLDRYKPTEYIEDKAKVFQKKNGVYTLDQTQGVPLIGENGSGQPLVNQMETNGQPLVNQMETEDKLSKDKLSKDKLIQDNTRQDNSKGNGVEGGDDDLFV